MRHFGIWGRKKETLHKNNSAQMKKYKLRDKET